MAADVTDDEAAIGRLNAKASTLADTEALARLLLRAESVASSRIEGLEIGARKLLLAELARELGERTTDVTAGDVLGNIEAMNGAIAEIAPGDRITVDTLLRFHSRLSVVPPPHELVPGLLEDLCSFCNTDSLPAVVQIALAHAQFETVHPFADGNGRTGRGLI